MPSPRFRVVSEGPTDFAVIRRILAGVFNDPDIEAERLPEPNPLVPADAANFGGWNNLFAFLGSSRFEAAFEFVDYVVVHVDTDVCQDFGVVTHESGKRLSDGAIVARVVERLQTEMLGAFDRIGSNIIFAVSVDSIECWLLLLYTKPGQPARSQNCLDHLNRALRAKNEKPIVANSKTILQYDRLAKAFSRRKDLEQYQGRNDSLALFFAAVDRITRG